MLGHESGGDQSGAVDAERPGATAAAGGEEPRDRGQRQLVHGVGHATAHLLLVGVLDCEAPLGDGLLVRGGVVLARVHGSTGHLVEVLGGEGTGPPEGGLDQLGLGIDVEAGQADGEVTPVAAEAVHRDLEGGWRRLAPRVADLDPVGRLLLEADGVETGCHVGAEVAGGADLVEQLRGHGADGDGTAGAVVLADHRGSVGGDVGPGEPGPFESGNLGEERVVAPGGLRAALDDVPGDDSAGEGVPVVACPAVVPGGRAADHGGVGGATGDHDVGATVERFDDAPAAEVGVGADEATGFGQGFAGDEVGEVHAGGEEVVEAREQVVAVDVGDGGGEAQPVGDLGDSLGASVRVETAGVGHDPDAPVEAGAHHLLHLSYEAAGIASAGALGLRAGEDQHREFGQPVAGEHVDRAAFDHLGGGREPVAVEA